MSWYLAWKRRMFPLGCAGLALLPLAACRHANRVSPAALQRLQSKSAPFTLVFGAVSTEARQLAYPTIRVVRQPNGTSPQYVLWSWTVDSGGRFFAVLQPPAELPYLDEFCVEVGDRATNFDRVLFVRLRQGDPPSGMYVGDLHISAPPERAVQGQTVKVEVSDNFEAALKELKRLYPRFSAPIVRVPLFLNRPAPVAVERR